MAGKRLLEFAKTPRTALFVFGLLMAALIAYFVEDARTFVISVLAAIALERFFDVGSDLVEGFRNTHPLRRTLEDLATDKAWVYLSPFYRNIEKPEESRLYRYEADKNLVSLPLINGTQFLYGKGDAVALSLVFRAIESVGATGNHIELEDAEAAVDKWGRPCVCIGAHNSKTRTILSQFEDTYFRFARNYSAIVRDTEEELEDYYGRKMIKGVVRDPVGDAPIRDYGVILKLRDQFSNDVPIIVIAGLGDWGTAGAAYFLKEHYQQLPFDRETFGCLVQVPSGYQSARLVKFEDVFGAIEIGE